MRDTFVDRRRFGSLLGGAALFALAGGCHARARTFPVMHTDDEWRRLLDPAQFYILRQAGTERPYSSALLNEHRKGTFTCAADGNRLFQSDTKFDSGTGWPSFWAPIKGAIGTESDLSLGIERTAVFCSRCGGHLGHVFDDGPAPTGLRYCMNGKAMHFVAA